MFFYLFIFYRAPKKKSGTGFSIFGKKSNKDVEKGSEKKEKKVGGTHTMHSTGIFDISKKKNNEYFGGDSTVTQAGKKKKNKMLKIN